MEPPYILAILDVLDYFALFGVSKSILVVLVGYSDHFVTEGVYFGQLHFMYKKKKDFFLKKFTLGQKNEKYFLSILKNVRKI